MLLIATVLTKRKALQRVIDRYGAYLSHLQALTEDTTIRSVDRQRLKGYLLKWKEGRILIGCALYIDILQSPSLLSLSLQDDCIDVASGIKNLFEISSLIKKIKFTRTPQVAISCKCLQQSKTRHKWFQ